MVFFLKAMKKKYRVKRNEDFQRIIQSRQYLASERFVLYYQKNDLGYLRIGLSVGKKLGKAVLRNRIKRQLREMAGSIFDFTLSFDLVIIVRKPYLEHGFQSNREDLEKLAGRFFRKIKKGE